MRDAGQRAIRIGHDLRALLACAARPITITNVAAALGLEVAAVEHALQREASSTEPIRRTPSGLSLEPDHARRRARKLTKQRRAWSHSLLARHANDLETRALHALRAGEDPFAIQLALRIRRPADSNADVVVELVRELRTGKTTKDADRHLGILLAYAYFASDRLDDAKALLEEMGASRSRNAELRLIWARVLNRQGQYADSLRRTALLLRRGDDGVSRNEVLDLHAHSLLLMGRGQEAVEILTRELERPARTTPLEELRLHLTRERCARESGVRSGARERTLELALVVREGRRRRDDELVADAAFRVGVALSDFGNDERALRWLHRARTAWIARGDEYRSAEVENSIGVLQHKLLRPEASRETFESAARRLTHLSESRALAIVRMNHADLTMDLLELDATRDALLFATHALGEGVLRLKAQLMLLDSGLDSGAAADITLDRLDELRLEHAQFERPASLAYLDSLRGRCLAMLEDRTAAADAYSSAADHYAAASRRQSAATALVHAACQSPDFASARRLVARAAWQTRPEIPTLVAVALATCGRRARIDIDSLLPLTRRRAVEIQSALRRLRDARRAPAESEHAYEDACAMAALFAHETHGRLPGIDSFVRDTIGASRWALLRRGPVGRQLLEQAFGMATADALRTNSPEPSRMNVSRDRWTLVIVHDDVEFKFGQRAQRLALDLLRLVEARTASTDPDETNDVAETPPVNSPEDATMPASRPSGRSKRIRELREQTLRLAKSLLPLVVLGEAGAGKDRLARFVHDCSDHASGPYVVLDCGAIPENLAESQLVGHEKGAFTGAERSHRGLLVAASGGTLVLDRVDRLPQRAQSLLLTALESNRVRALGALTEVDVRLRVVTMSTKPLEAFVSSGSLRSELAWHLDGARLPLPPLRARREDIPLLARELATEENSGRTRSIDPRILESLQLEEWPGNLTELRNRIRRALLLSPTDARLGRELLHGDATPSVPQVAAPKLAHRLRVIERQLIAEALEANGGHRERSARSLGISRRWLQKRIRELELD